MMEMDIWVAVTGASLVWAGGWSFFKLFAGNRKDGRR